MYVYKKKRYIFIFTLLDLLGGILFAPVRVFWRKKADNPQRILLIRIDHIGDVINATAVLEPLKKTFPGAVVDFLGPSWAFKFIKGDKLVDNFINFDAAWFQRTPSGLLKRLKDVHRMIKIIKKGKYDLGIDLRGDFRHITAMFLAGVKRRVSYGITGGGFLLTQRVPYRGKMHEIDRDMELLNAVGVRGEPSGVRLFFTDEDRSGADDLVRKAGIKDRCAVLHAAPGHAAKRWDPEKFAKIADHLLKDKKMPPLIIGAKKDGQEARRIRELAGPGVVDITGKTSLGILYYLLSRTALFIGVDSGPAHIAAAAGIPTVILFSGVNDPGQWAPRGKNVRIIYPGKDKDLSNVQPEEVCKVIDEVPIL